MRWIFRTLGLALFAVSVAVPSAAQFDPFKKIREKGEAIQKKIDCAVGDKACADKNKPGGKDIAPAATLDAKVSVTVLAPMPVNTLIPSVISDDFAHGAGVAMQGSRMVVMVDGVEGPPFDAIVTSGSGAAVFSPDGKRVAYIGRRNGQQIAVIDGKEGPPFTGIGARMNLSGGSKPAFLFSKDGARVAYVATMPSASQPATPLTRGPSISARVVLDGVLGPEYDSIGDMLFARQQLVYAGYTKEHKWAAVIDGKPMPGTPFDSINFLTASDDGHFAFVGMRGNSWTVVLDGVEGKTHQRPAEQFDGRTIVLSPVKGRVAYLAVSAQPNSHIPAVNLYLDGKVLRTATGFDGLTFSPDGTRLAGAVIQTNPDTTSRRYFFVDDWNSLDYGGAVMAATPTLYFSPDSKHFAFIAGNGMSSFAVVDGKESSGYAEIKNFQFSKDGRRHAFEARYPNTSGGGSVVVVDGKEGPKLRSLTANSLTFSPDGSRVAYTGNLTVTEEVAVVDGTSQKAPAGKFMPRVPKAAGAVPSYFVFSPDGRRLAHVEQLLDGSGQSVVVLDGTKQTPGHLFTMPVFLSDGRHFAYATWFNQKWLLSLDGKSLPIDGDLYEAPGSLTFQDDGSVRLLAVKDNMLCKLVIAPK